jgi:hypothetical protein
MKINSGSFDLDTDLLFVNTRGPDFRIDDSLFPTGLFKFQKRQTKFMKPISSIKVKLIDNYFF